MKQQRKEWCGCPIRFAMRFFGDKWSFLIIRDILFFGKRHYSDFLDSGEGIATNVLATRLANLEREGIIRKSRDPDNAAKYVYELTEMGLDLLPIMLSIVEWSAKYDDHTLVPSKFLKKLRANRRQFEKELRTIYRKGLTIGAI